MDQRTAHPHRLFRLCAIGLLLLSTLVGCGGRGGAVAPVDELSERPRNTPATHRVVTGETLYSIAFLYGIDFQRVARWNGIRSPYLIRAGQRLRLTPPGGVAKASRKPAGAADKARQKESKPVKRVPARRPPPVASAKSAAPRAEAKKAPKPAKPSGGSAKIRWRWPTDGKLLSTFSSRKPGRKGVDIGGKRGQPVVAAAGGEVVYSGNGLQRYYGKLIIIKHNDRYLSAYAHNQRLLVKEGQRVKAGQRIADLGDSGTDRVKLHFEIRRDGKPVNPMRYLPKH